MTSLGARFTDSQRVVVIVAATLATLVAIAIVNLAASWAAKQHSTHTDAVVSVCAKDPHGSACQKAVLPRVFSEATSDELARYRRSIALRELQLEGRP